jgi:hypothetical protein
LRLRMTYLLDLLGVGVFALSGALAGIHRGLDLFGIAVLAMVTGIGGGTLRDVLLHRYPILWVRDSNYLYVILAAALIAVLGQRILPNLEAAFLIADAMGLGLFALSGAQAIEGEGHAWIIAVLLGTMSGVAGGVIRGGEHRSARATGAPGLPRPPAIDRFARSIAHWSLDQGCCGSMASNGCQVRQKCSVVKVLNGCGPCGVSNCI